MALATAKRLVDEGVELPFDTAVGLERDAVAMLFATDDRREGVAAFLEKRQPDLHRPSAGGVRKSFSNVSTVIARTASSGAPSNSLCSVSWVCPYVPSRWG